LLKVKELSRQDASASFTPVTLATFEVEIGRISGSNPAWANSSGTPISKITRATWTGGEAQVVESLLCKHQVLSSNPIPIKKKKKKEELSRS
jgi:hypothetical protein